MIQAGFLGAESRKVVEVEVDVVRDEEVDEAVVVVVAEGSAGGPSVIDAKASGLRDVGEGAVTVIAVKNDATETGDEEVGPSVVIVIADGDAHGPAGETYAGFVGDVGKGAVAIVVVEGAARLCAGERHINVGRVGEVDVWPAVTIVVDKRHATAHGFDDIAVFGGGEMVEMDASFLRDIDELRCGRLDGRRTVLGKCTSEGR